MPFLHALDAGALVMAPMTKGSNLPYRRLCQELGADVTMSEMVVVRRLKQRQPRRVRADPAWPDERCFGVQLADKGTDDLAWGVALVEERGADVVDLNLGCPIDEFTRRGLGSALLRRPTKVRALVEAMKRGVTRVPVTVKIRLGWNDEELNALDVAAGGGGRWRRCHDHPRPDAQRTISPRGGLGGDRRGGESAARFQSSATATSCIPKTSSGPARCRDAGA